MQRKTLLPLLPPFATVAALACNNTACYSYISLRIATMGNLLDPVFSK